jgi:twitching motility protein PilI
MASPDAAPERRSRLAEYQVELLERMQAARTTSGARAHQLGVEIGGVRYLLDLLEAGEIVPAAPLTPVPLTQPWYLGLANVRGNLVGVIDLARYFGQAQAAVPAGAGGRLVTFSPALGMPCALLVSRVFGLRHTGDGHEHIEWTPLSLAALVREERFLHIGL